MGDDNRAWLVQEAKKLAEECFDDSTRLIAAAVICLDLIVDQLAEIDSRLGEIDYELEAQRGLHKDNTND